MEERKDNTTKSEVALKVFKILRYAATAIGCLLVFLAFIAINNVLNYASDSVIKVENANKILTMLYQPYPENLAYELEARIVDDAKKGMWYHGAIDADLGDQIEVRLKAFSAHPENVGRDMVYDNGLSISQTVGLKIVEMFLDEKATLPNGELTDYPENANSDNVQYYYIGTYRFSWKEWVNGKPAAMLTAYNYNGPSASLLVLSPYSIVIIRAIVALLGLAVLFLFVIPLAIDVVEYIIIKRLASMH